MDLSYEAAMHLETEEQAEAWLDKISAEYLQNNPLAEPEATRTKFRESAAYYAGYFGQDTRARVERIFKTAHPILGAWDRPDPLSIPDIIKLGFEFGQRVRAHQEDV